MVRATGAEPAWCYFGKNEKRILKNQGSRKKARMGLEWEIGSEP